ncbi:MAG: PHP domain-containing protein [Bryobacterales bacterium]|nr:PHP domain-containing protein [Bryobacterales bacterium]
MIDLHAHTNYSDGTCSPGELLELAYRKGLDALAITDHDNLNGYDAALALPHPPSLRLVCGIEITCRMGRKAPHLLGYFFDGQPAPEFREWLTGRYEQRRDRNRRLEQRLRELGYDIDLAQVEALGRSMTGRPHFARVLVAKGYFASIDEAFQRLLGEDAPGYVEHEAPSLAEAIRRVRECGGIASLAHPIRLALPDEEAFLRGLKQEGLHAVEVFHSDQPGHRGATYFEIARKLDLAVSGGSDFHGAVKPRVDLGCANVENWVLEELLKIANR